MISRYPRLKHYPLENGEIRSININVCEDFLLDKKVFIFQMVSKNSSPKIDVISSELIDSLDSDITQKMQSIFSFVTIPPFYDVDNRYNITNILRKGTMAVYSYEKIQSYYKISETELIPQSTYPNRYPILELDKESNYSLLTGYPGIGVERMYRRQFFFKDDKYTFFVEPTLIETPFYEKEQANLPSGNETQTTHIDNTLVINLGDYKNIKEGGGPSIPDPAGPIQQKISNHARFDLKSYKDNIINPETAIYLGESLIGYAGRLESTMQATVTSNALKVIGGGGLNAAVLMGGTSTGGLIPR